MGKLTDLLREENADAEAAALAAAAGRSLTGLSGHHANIAETPIAGERVAPVRGADAPTTAPGSLGPRKRVPFGAMTPTLAAPDRPGFHRHWFNDEPGRIDRAKLGGYQHAQDQKGDPVSRVTGRAEGGQARKSYLMEIPIEWYREDVAAQDAALEDRLAEIRHGRSGPGSADHRYIPQQGITVKTGIR
jgi:hypothetical protein